MYYESGYCFKENARILCSYANPLKSTTLTLLYPAKQLHHVLSLWQLFRQCRYCYHSSKLTKIYKMVERVFYHKHMEEFRDKHFLPAKS